MCNVDPLAPVLPEIVENLLSKVVKQRETIVFHIYSLTVYSILFHPQLWKTLEWTVSCLLNTKQSGHLVIVHLRAWLLSTRIWRLVTCWIAVNVDIVSPIHLAKTHRFSQPTLGLKDCCTYWKSFSKCFPSAWMKNTKHSTNSPKKTTQTKEALSAFDQSYP